MKPESDNEGIRAGYVALLIVSLLVPVFHLLTLNPQLDRLRDPATGLMPLFFLMARHDGYLWFATPITILILLLLSWRVQWLNTPRTLAKTAIWLFVLMTLHAIYVAWAFSLAVAVYL